MTFPASKRLGMTRFVDETGLRCCRPASGFTTEKVSVLYDESRNIS